MQPPSDKSDQDSVEAAKDSILGTKLSIDYVAAGEEASRIELFFDRDEGLDLDSLVAAVESHLGLSPDQDHEGPAIAAVTTVEAPLDLGDLLSDQGQAIIDDEASAPVGPAGASVSEAMVSFWSDDPVALNDNDVTTDF